MGLLDNAKKDAQVEAPMAAEAETTAPAKKHNNSDYQKRQREHQFKAACTVRDFIKGLKCEVPAEVQAELDFLCKEKKAGAGSSNFGTPVIYKIFGNTPKKGDKVTAMKVFEETGKGFGEMRQLMKKWNANGTVVKYDEASRSYEIVGDIPAFNA